MSIRDELAGLIDAMHLPDAIRGGRWAETVSDHLLARFGVVELPEPTVQAGAGSGEWRVDEATTIFAYCSHVEFDGRDAWYESPAHARALAAALLAAANRAEATDVDR